MGKSSLLLLNAVALVCLFAGGVFAQAPQASAANSTAPTAAKQTAGTMPKMAEYRGVKIGMTGKEVRQAISEKPTVEDDSGFYYMFSDDESAQISLDADKKVRAIAVNYGKGATAPKFEDVFGPSVTAPKGDDGGTYDLVRYPDAGFWVSYSRSGGDTGRVTIMMQKMTIE